MQIGLPSDNDQRLSIEHLIDIEDGGTNEPENLRLVHQSCNDLSNLLKQRKARLEAGLEPTKRMEAMIALHLSRMKEEA